MYMTKSAILNTNKSVTLHGGRKIWKQYYNRRENAPFGQSYVCQREELLRRAKRRVKKLLVIVRNGTLGKTGTSRSKVKNTLWNGEILPSGCTQVTSNIYCIEGVAVKE